MTSNVSLKCFTPKKSKTSKISKDINIPVQMSIKVPKLTICMYLHAFSDSSSVVRP